MKPAGEKFLGFPPKRVNGNFWCYPSTLCLHWNELRGSEHKVLDCILRHTWGFNRQSDRISLSQLEYGVRNVHSGVGVSKKQIIRALRSLQEKGFITSVKSSRTNEYSLVIEVHQELGTKGNTSGVPASPANGDKSKQDTGVEITHTKDNIEIEIAIKRLYELYSLHIHSGTRLTSQGRKNIVARLTEYYPQELIAALKNVQESDYWKPIAETSTPRWFFASEERIATFLALGPHEWHPKEVIAS